MDSKRKEKAILKNTSESSAALALREFLDQRAQQKLRGINDYNLIGSMLKWHDEVRLHSGFLYSLLNPDGLHYQGDLFLRKFIEILKIKDFDYGNARVEKERKRVDLSITDGKIQVIIELKIFAVDQKDQAARYIALHNKEFDDKHTSLHFVYLTAGRDLLSATSLSPELTVRDGFIYKDTQKVCRYHSLHYHSDVLRWLDACQAEVCNIKNLDYALSEYRDIVKRVSRAHKSKLSAFDAFFLPQHELVERIKLIQQLMTSRKSSNMNGNSDMEFTVAEIKELRTLAISHVSNLLEQALHDFDKILDESKAFAKLTLKNTDTDLSKYLFKKGNTRGFFEARNRSKNKGSFWVPNNQLKQGEECWAVTLLYGSKLLHLGLVRVRLDGHSAEEAKWALVRPATIDTANDVPDNVHGLELSKPYLNRLCLHSVHTPIYDNDLAVPAVEAFTLAGIFGNQGGNSVSFCGTLRNLLDYVTRRDK